VVPVSSDSTPDPGHWLRWLGLALVIVLADQLTKYAVVRSFALHEGLAITPFFNMVLVYNSGAAFSLLSDAAGWQRGFFIAIAVAASGWVIWLLRRHSGQRLFCFALGLILGGAIGNLIDRVLVGAVVDFLDFHAMGIHWPAFNVADTAISCGAVLLIWDAFKPAPKHGN
jgi:signal peptidase II